MTPTVRGAVDRARKYLKNLPHLNIIGTAVARGSEFRSAEWGSGSYQLTREDLQLILDQAVPYERPSRLSGTPEQWDAYLREAMADDVRLKFYQWIGQHAVAEAIADVRRAFGDDPVPVEQRYYTPDSVDEMLDHVDPKQGANPYPSQLPLGLPFCDVD